MLIDCSEQWNTYLPLGGRVATEDATCSSQQRFFWTSKPIHTVCGTGQPATEPTEPTEPAEDSRIIEAAIIGDGLAGARGAAAVRAPTENTRIPAPARVLGIPTI